MEDEIQPNGSRKKKRWYLVGAGAVATALLAPAGAWAFNSIVSAIQTSNDVPFNASLAQGGDGCEEFVLDESLVREIPPVDENGNIDEEWLSNNKALESSLQEITLTLVGDESKSVVITDVRLADVKAVTPPENPVVVGECPPGAGGLPTNTMRPDFESGAIEMLDPDGTEITALTIGSGGSPEVFLIVPAVVTAEKPPCYCTWRIAIDWTSSNGKGTETLDLDGQPLSTVSTTEYAKRYWFEEAVLYTYGDEDRDATWVPVD